MKKDNKKNRQDEGWGIQKYCQETVNISGPKTKCYTMFLLKPFTLLFLPFLLRFLSLPLYAQQHSPLRALALKNANAISKAFLAFHN